MTRVGLSGVVRLPFARRSSCSARPRRRWIRTPSRPSTTPTPSACSSSSRAACWTSTSPSTCFRRRSPWRSSGAASSAARRRGGAGLAVLDRPLGALRTTGATAASSARRWPGSGCPCPGLSDPEIERIEDMAGLGEVAAPLADAMAALPEEQRRAVELRVIDECGYADVAVQARRQRADGPGARVARAARARAAAAASPKRCWRTRHERARASCASTCARRRARDIEAERARARRRAPAHDGVPSPRSCSAARRRRPRPT